MVGLVLASAALAVWIYLIVGRGGFWRAAERDDRDQPPDPVLWPRVIAVIPARDEADVIGQSLRSLVSQDYSGDFDVVLVDDQSRDGTAEAARAAAQDAGAASRLTVVSGRPLPEGWSGKVWAMQQGVEQAERDPRPPDYLLLTDADIAYGPGALRSLVARAEMRRLAMASLMVRLRCEDFSERALIPAFVFFFQMLYPFAWVNRADCSTAAAAGGCMLVRRDALAAAGGMASLRGVLIDDCALARRIKAVGPIWLGLTERVHSLRAYPSFGHIRRMVARSAYDQLGYSPLRLLGAVAGMGITYLAPPALAIAATGAAQALGALAYLAMVLALWPILRLYRLSPLWGLALPAIALAYMAYTVDSAYQHWRGRGGLWKGRVQARAMEPE
jgi:hopene-associated glycosyltransferase HpnB